MNTDDPIYEAQLDYLDLLDDLFITLSDAINDRAGEMGDELLHVDVVLDTIREALKDA